MFRGLVYLLFGATVGAVLGVLFAPRPGEETRERLGDWLNAKREEGAHAISELRQRLPEESKKLTEAIKSGTERFRQHGRRKAVAKA